ncbi:DUF5906 domain-containing protein [Rhizobium leguminosarum]|uniref:phage NrS-1 polymerase family protein n=1 Tax=Rhizobium leguminosarum TaxID=384 RepID=UPI001441A6FB|nr:DUF5906 domain-containing protein [Rhizobium leguminosarum]MBY5863302.1 hypothetical protein [Rhizobium leguminosarum]NKM04180.1 hypothetical protein [Rhizobium leguminosarum bv. viciae]
MTDDDPWFLLDLDDCRDPVSGQWHPEALRIANMFPGACMEVSVNGTGLHVMGVCDPLALGPRKHKFDSPARPKIKWLEFYCTKRFVALGQGMQGNINLDWTSTLAALVPVSSDPADAVPFTEATDPAWNGPADDDELIRIMLAAKGSIAASFGDTATVGDLWEARADILGRVYPGIDGKPWDGNGVDQALMNHLAFYTGKNTARMDRLFRRSGLMRAKWEDRPDYRGWTISKAVRSCRNVYSRPRQLTIPLAAPGGEPGASPVAAVVGDGREFIGLGEMPDYFKGCVYVELDERIMVPGGRLLKRTQFDVVYGGHQFAMSFDGSKPTYSAWEAFTVNRAINFPKVQRTCFKPMSPSGVILGDAVNIYFCEEVRTVEGDPAPFLDFFRRILPDQRDREILLSWMAALVQFPGKKFYWSPVLQGTKGNGKSTIGEILSYAIGDRYSWTPEAESITKQFNPFLGNRIFINVEEIHMFEKLEMLEKLKNYITGRKVEIEKKGIDAGMNRDYCANWFFCTNHKDAIIKEKDDRRFAIFYTAQQSREDMFRDGMLTDNYFPKLWTWLEQQDGFAIMRHYLLNYQIQDEFNPATSCTLAPTTSSTHEAVSASYGVAEQYIMEAIDSDVQGFRGGWISTWAVSNLLRNNGLKRPPRKIASICEALGYQAVGKTTTTVMQEGNSRPTLYAKPGTAIAYEVAQGYIAPQMRVA